MKSQTVFARFPAGPAFILGAMLVLGGPGDVAAQGTPVAVVMKVEGDVQVVPNGGAAGAAAVGTRLSVGDRLVPADGASVVVVHQTGQRQEITEETTVSAPRTAERGDMFDRTMQVLSQAANSNARVSPNRQGMIRPLPGQPVKVAPRLGILVAETRPTFVWRSYEDAESYTIQIRRVGAPPVRFSASDTVFTLPADAEPLEPGETYYWTIAPSNTRRPAMEDSVRIADESTLASVEEAMETIESSGFDPEGDGRLLAAVVLADAGLYYAALEEIEALSGSEAVGRNVLMLKGEVLDEIGRVDEAREAFDQADEVTN